MLQRRNSCVKSGKLSGMLQIPPIQRVRAIEEALVELYERRDATHADRSRIEAFRRAARTTKTDSPNALRLRAPTVSLVSSDPSSGSEEGEIRDCRPAGPRTLLETTYSTEHGIGPD